MPRDLKQVRALLGGVGFYRKFLRDLFKRIRPITSFLRKGFKFEFMPAMGVIVISPSLPLHQFWSSPTETPWPTAPIPSTCTATRASTVFVLRSNRSKRTAQFGPSFTSAALPSIPTKLRATLKLAALSGPSNASEATFGARSFAYFRITKSLEGIGKVGDHNARAQRWLEFLTLFRPPPRVPHG